MSAHAPGPWYAKLEQFDFSNSGERTVMQGVPADEIYSRVALVSTRLERKERGKNATPYNAPDAERDANASLIAAAPELLEACEGALKVAKGDETSGLGWQAIEALEAAIAKALGK